MPSNAPASHSNSARKTKFVNLLLSSVTPQSQERERKSKVDLHVTPNLSQFQQTRSNLMCWLLLPNPIDCNWAITCERIVDERGVFIGEFFPPMAIGWWGEMIRLLLHPSRHLFQSHYMLLTVPTPIAQAAIHPGIPFSSSPHTSSPFDLRRSTAQLLLLLLIIVIIPTSAITIHLPNHANFTFCPIVPLQAGPCTLEDLVEAWATLTQSKQSNNK